MYSLAYIVRSAFSTRSAFLFAGQLISQYLARQVRDGRLPASFRFALGGRNEGKLNEIRQGLIAISPRLESTVGHISSVVTQLHALRMFDSAKGIKCIGLSQGVVVGDASDQKSVDEVVSRTKVIISSAGPYMKYGTISTLSSGEHCSRVISAHLLSRACVRCFQVPPWLTHVFVWAPTTSTLLESFPG